MGVTRPTLRCAQGGRGQVPPEHFAEALGQGREAVLQLKEEAALPVLWGRQQDLQARPLVMQGIWRKDHRQGKQQARLFPASLPYSLLLCQPHSLVSDSRLIQQLASGTQATRLLRYGLLQCRRDGRKRTPTHRGERERGLPVPDAEPLRRSLSCPGRTGRLLSPSLIN